MKQLKIILFITSIIAWGSRLQGQIVSDTLGCVPFLVNFKSPIDTIKKPLWNFMDGATSDKKNASHVFVSPGTYNITLSNYGAQILVQKIVVLPKIIPEITLDIDRGCAPLAIKFTNNSVIPPGLVINGYLWDFGDGDSSEEISPYHTYTDIDQYNVTLNIETNIAQCNISKTFDDIVIIDQKQNVGFTVDSISPNCMYPTYVYVTNTGILNSSFKYMWDFGNGTTSTEMFPSTAKYESSGFYNISLVVDNQLGCVSKVTKTVDINYNPPFRVMYKDTICGKNKVKFTNSTIATSFFWDFGVYAQPQESTLNSPEVKFDSTGLIKIKLTIKTQTGCSKDTFLQIVVKDKSADFIFDPPIICRTPNEVFCNAVVNNYNKYEWNNVIGTTTYKVPLPFIERDSFYYNLTDSVVVKLKITDIDGCQATMVKTYKYQLPNAQFTISEHEGVVPFIVRIKDESESTCPIVKWLFSWGDGTTAEYDSTTISMASHEYVEPGQYYINLSILTSCGCHDLYFGAWIDAQAPLVEVIPPVCMFSGDPPSICSGDRYKLEITNEPIGVDAYQFNFGKTVSGCESEKSIEGIMYNDPGSYSIVLTLENGGTFTDIKSNKQVMVLGPKAGLDYQVLCDGSYRVIFKNTSKQATHIRWLIDNQAFTQDTFIYTFSGRGDYAVQLIAFNDDTGCTPDTANAMIMLRDVKAKITTDDLWCYNQSMKLISTASEDEVHGCKMGYVWIFPENIKKPTIVTDKDTVITVLPPGNHRITLQVRDVNGCIDTDYYDIKSYNIKTNFISDFAEVCVPLNATFTDSTVHDTTIIDYKWSIDPTHNLPEISHTIGQFAGNKYFVTLRTIDALGCRDSVTKEYKVYKPETKITIPSIICESNKMTFAATDFTTKGSFLSYQWFIDSVATAETMSFIKDGFAPGQHNGKLIIKEAASQCTNEYDFSFYVTKVPKAVISGLSDSVFCYPKSILLSADQSIIDPMDKVTYKWSYSNGRTSNKPNTIETFGKGKFNVKLRIRSAYQCESTTEKDIRLIGPEGQIVVDKEVVCKGEKVTFKLVNPVDVTSFFWDFGQGEIGNNSSPVAYKYDFYPPSGETFASLVIKGSEKNCQIVVSRPIRLYKVNAQFDKDSICGLSIDVKNKSLGGDKFTWIWKDNIQTTSDSNITISVVKSGIYPIKLAIENNQWGCKDTFIDQLVFFDLPVLSIPDNVSVCSGNELVFPAADNNIYIFDPPNVGTVFNGDIIIKTSTDALIVVKAITYDGCKIADSIRVNVKEAINLETQSILWDCDGRSNPILQVDAKPSDKVIWLIEGQNVIEILSCLDCTNPSIIKPFSGIIEAIVTNVSLCKNYKYQFEIKQADIQIPNVFSPNNDKVNDLFRPISTNILLNEEIVIEELKIFNQWGNKIFDGKKPWDGMYNGAPASAEVYYFTMTYKLGTACTNTVKGDVTLLK
jgi:gliding motility-associated-like protein